jgi:hypothetical protein
MSWKRHMPSPASVIALIALVVALGGTAYAVKIKRNSVGPKQLKTNAVTTKKISDGAVTGPKLANGAVTGGKLADGAVTSAKLGDGAVTGGKLGDGAVGRAKLESDEQVAWALVNGSTNGIVAQSGGISLALGSGGGEYFVRFPVQLPGRAVVAILQTAQSSGEIQTGICGSTAPVSGVEQLLCNTANASDNNPSVARIDTSTSAGAASPRNFYVAVLAK